MIKVICIDDENDARYLLLKALDDLGISDLQIVGEANGVKNGIKLIEKADPDLIFLDIQMQDGTGFDLLEEINVNAEVIFLTAYDKFAIKAFKYSAFDYLLKPIKQSELKASIERFLEDKKFNTINKTEQLKKAIDKNYEAITFRDMNGYKIINSADLIRIESQNQYVHVYTKDLDFIVSKNLKYYETMLEENSFFRIHNRHIINLNWVEKINGNDVLLKNGETFPISRARKKSFLELI